MNAFQAAIENLLQAFQPVITAADDEYTRKALLEALDLPIVSTALPLIPATAIQNIENFLDITDPELDDFLKIIPDLLDVADAVRTFANSAVTEAALADPLNAIQQAFEAAVSVLTIHLLKNAYPVVYCVLRMLQIIETKLTDHWSETLHVERIGKLLGDAHNYFRTFLPLQNEDDAKSTSDAVFKPLAALAGYLQDRAIRPTARPIRPFYGTDLPPDTPPSLTATVAEAVSKRALTFGVGRHDADNDIDVTILFSLAFVHADHGGPGLMLSFLGADVEVPVAEGWTLDAALGADTELSLWWMFGSDLKVLGNAGASLAVELRHTPEPSDPPLSMPLFGGTRVEMGDISFRLEANGRDVDARVTLHNWALIAGAASGDSFTRSVTPSSGARAAVDLILGISGTRGVYIGATAGLTATFVLHKTIGPLHLDTLTVELRPAQQGSDLRLAAKLTLSIEIGPVAVSIDGIGMRADISFPASGANLGVLDLKPAFQWPRGAGVVINAGPLKGGGFLSFDEAEGRYSGVLQLQFKNIAIKAIGILDTKLPSGEKGYSFLLILTAEFAPIQLGMGFTLNGVGGLAGIHRTVAVPELQAGIRSHATDSVLFPKDPVKNAPRILSDLQRYFPRQKNHYIFGPMAIIGWGKPTLATIKLGIILEFPPPLRIVLLGQLDCKLPDATAVVDLHVDVLGVLDFGAQTFALDGTVHDSRIGPYSLSGDFAVRLKWGSAPTFALAIGGFHPAFRQIPAGFPTLRRMTLALSSGDNPRLTLQCYIALTSNSLQFGARAELYASASGFSVSGWIGFDVLIIFHPFGFLASLSAGFVLRRGNKNLGGIHVDATLTGPSPWHVWGEATISILFIDVTVSFDVTIGSGGPGALPSVVVWTALQTGLQEPGNWSGVLPVAAAHVVTVKKPSLVAYAIINAMLVEVAGTIIDPVGTITLVERVAPLARRISLFADARPSGITRFDLQRVSIGTRATVPHQYTQELFAPAQFEQLSDPEKLSRPSFERVAAGMALTDRVAVAGVAGTPITCRSVVFDSPFESHDGADYAIAAEAQVALADAGSNATGGMRLATQSYITPGAKPKVTLDDETYVIAAANDLKARLDIAPAGTKGAVFSALAEYLAGHAGQRGNLTVVAAYEAEAA